MDVTMLRWPDEHGRREALSQSRGPRLLLVPDGQEPPAVEDCLEDWIRVPAEENEVRARVDALAARSQAHMVDDDSTAPDADGNGDSPNGSGSGNLNAVLAAPEIDDFGVLRYGSAWVALPPLEARLTETLLERMGTVTSRELLVRAGWPSGAPGRNALDVHVLRLRRRLTPVGLAIRTVRSRGYLMEPARPGAAGV